MAILLGSAPITLPLHAAPNQKTIQTKPSPVPQTNASPTPVSTPRIRRTLKVGSIQFEGNHEFSDGKLLKAMLTRRPRWFKKYAYFPEVFEQDLNRILDLYRRRGFLQAEIDDKQVLEDRNKSQVDLTVWLYEGSRSEVKNIRWSGITAFTPGMILRRLLFKTGDPLDRDLLEGSVRNLLRAYSEEGYLEAEVKPSLAWDTDHKNADVVFTVKEGPLCTLNELTVEGLVRMRDWVVRREFRRIKRGDPLRWNKIEAAQTRLYLTGLFQSLMVKPVTLKGPQPGARNLLVEVLEAQAREINLSGGWGSEDRFHGQVEVAHNNMFGRARRMSVLASAGRRIQRLEWNYGTFWIAGLPWFNNLNAFGELQEQPGYDLRRVGGSFLVGHNLSPVSKFQVAYRHENAYLAHVTLSPAPDLSSSTVRAFSLSLLLDKRDSFTNPKNGLYLTSSAEISGAFLKGTDTFVKTVNQVRLYRSLSRGTVIAAGAELGWVHNYRSAKAIPISELFFAGGANSLRGFEYRTAGPLDSQGLPLGGEFSLVLNAGEIRQKVWRFLGLVGFLDGGSVFTKADHFTLGSLRWTAGYGLRAETRLGILRVDQGFIIDKKPSEKPWKIVFSLGQAF